MKLRNTTIALKNNTKHRFLETQSNQNLFSIGVTVAATRIPNSNKYLSVTDQCANDLQNCKPTLFINSVSIDVVSQQSAPPLLPEKLDSSMFPTTPAIICQDNNEYCFIVWLHWVNNSEGKVIGRPRIVKFNYQLSAVREIDISNSPIFQVYPGFQSYCIPCQVDPFTCTPFYNGLFVNNQPYSISLTVVKDNSLYIALTQTYIYTNEKTLGVYRYQMLLNSSSQLTWTLPWCDGKKTFDSSVEQVDALSPDGMASYGVTLTSLATFNEDDNYFFHAYYSFKEKNVRTLACIKPTTQFAILCYPPIFTLPVNGTRNNVKLISHGRMIITIWESLNQTAQIYMNAYWILSFPKNMQDTVNLKSIIPTHQISNTTLYDNINPSGAISDDEIINIAYHQYDVKADHYRETIVVKYNLSNSQINPYTQPYDFNIISTRERSVYGCSPIVCFENDKCIIVNVNNNNEVEPQLLWKKPSNENSCYRIFEPICKYPVPSSIAISIITFFVLGIFWNKYFRKNDSNDNQSNYTEISNQEAKIEMPSLNNQDNINCSIQLFNVRQKIFIDRFVFQFEKVLNFYTTLVRDNIIQVENDIFSKLIDCYRSALIYQTDRVVYGEISGNAASLPFKIDLPLAIAGLAIIEFLQYLRNRNVKLQAHCFFNSFGNKPLREKTREIYDCAIFLSKRYLDQINLLTNDNIAFLADRTVDRIVQNIIEASQQNIVSYYSHYFSSCVFYLLSIPEPQIEYEQRPLKDIAIDAMSKHIYSCIGSNFPLEKNPILILETTSKKSVELTARKIFEHTAIFTEDGRVYKSWLKAVYTALGQNYEDYGFIYATPQEATKRWMWEIKIPNSVARFNVDPTHIEFGRIFNMPMEEVNGVLDKVRRHIALPSDRYSLYCLCLASEIGVNGPEPGKLYLAIEGRRQQIKYKTNLTPGNDFVVLGGELSQQQMTELYNAIDRKKLIEISEDCKKALLAVTSSQKHTHLNFLAWLNHNPYEALCDFIKKNSTLSSYQNAQLSQILLNQNENLEAGLEYNLYFYILMQKNDSINGNIEQFIKNFTDTFYFTYSFYVGVSNGEILTRQEEHRRAATQITQQIVSNVTPDILMSPTHIGLPLPFLIRIPTGDIIKAIIYLFESWRRQTQIAEARRTVEFFENNDMHDRVEDIYFCAQYLVKFYNDISSLKSPSVMLLTEFMVSRIFREIGEKNFTIINVIRRLLGNTSDTRKTLAEVVSSALINNNTIRQNGKILTYTSSNPNNPKTVGAFFAKQRSSNIDNPVQDLSNRQSFILTISKR